MWTELQPGREISRAWEIASAATRYGGGELIARIGLHRALRKRGAAPLPAAQGEASSGTTPAERFRCALQELGPTFVKLGQVMATRVDLFPPDWIAQLEQLQNHVPGEPWTVIRAQLCEDLGAPPEEVFAEIDPEPLAAASIAQVHRARLHDGRAVVVKVRRPGIRTVVEADLRLLKRIARAAESHLPELRRFRLPAVVDQLRASLTRELDLAAECRHAERIAARFAGDPTLVIPAVHWAHTGERVNVQDLVEGIPIADLPALEAAGIDRRELARRGAQAVLCMMLRDGFFHADPHPGNVFALPGNRLALVDFGMVGRLSRQRRAEVVALLWGLVGRDAEAVVQILLEWTDDGAVDEGRLAQDVDAFVDRYHGVVLGQLNLAQMLLDVVRLLQAHELALPADLALVVKVCVTLEGLGRLLDDQFDMAAQARPFLRRQVRERFSPASLLRHGSHALVELAEVLAGLPHDLRRAVGAARRGRLKLQVASEELRHFATQLDHSANRLTMGIVVAALVIGSSITMTVAGGPTLLGLPVFGFLGFVGAVVAGSWLIFSIWRSGGGR
jgi:ubiquinone biosynthesis protein